MRIKVVSVFCVFLPLIYCPRPTAAQFNPTLPPMPQAFLRKLPSPGKLSEFRASASDEDVRADAHLISELKSLLQRRVDVQRLQAGAKGIQTPMEANRCAHITIIEAPDVDSKMIKEVQKEFASNMPVWQGRQSCCGDFLGITVIPRASPLVNPGQIGGFALKPGMRFFGPQP